jgi:DNA-binding response OmpR family regulator/GGDEF domain-containing protein
VSESACFSPVFPLRILAILRDPPTAQLMSRTVAQNGLGDELSIATDLAEGLARSLAEAPHVVFVDVSLGKTAGLATVHHLRAAIPQATIYALAASEVLELGTQALALGAAGLLVSPLSGDELLTCLAEVRTRHAERRQLELLSREANRSRAGATLLSRVIEISEARTRRDAAERLADVLFDEAGAHPVLVYLAAAEGARQLMRSAVRGEVADTPAFCDELELSSFAKQHGLEVVRLASRREHGGLLLLGGLPPHAQDEPPLPLIDLVAAHAATALALIGEREQSHRGAMKDPDSSAYTFAYFVDVAGREIDKARRHGRRFALATLAIEYPQTQDPRERGHTSVQVVERVLGAVRDTDVLARVDEHEFLMLLPETGGIGAHACRRRVMRELGGFATGARLLHDTPRIAIGVATFPHDGMDLSQLLRVAKHRADLSCHPAVRRLCQEAVPLAQMLDLVTWELADSGPDAAQAAETLRVLEVSQVELMSLATAVLGYALRGGGARVVAAQRPGVSLGAAVRSTLGRDVPDVQVDLVDVSAVSGCVDLEALALIAEHGAYALLGRVEGTVVHAVHTADPLFADVLIQRLGEASGVRLSD